MTEYAGRQSLLPGKAHPLFQYSNLPAGHLHVCHDCRGPKYSVKRDAGHANDVKQPMWQAHEMLAHVKNHQGK